MKPKSIKHAEWYILNYLLTGEGAHMQADGLDDVADYLWVNKDKYAKKRFITACKNVETVLSNMLSKRPEPEDEVVK